MKKFSSVIFLLVSIIILLTFLSLVFPKSPNPCISCHTLYSQYLDIVEGDGGNSIPSTIGVGETKTVKVTIKNICNTQTYSTMSSVSATLSSQAGHFSVRSATYNVGKLPVGSASAVWTITGVSAGTDTLLITARAANTHNSLSFSDSYSPSPSITVAQSSPPPPPALSISIVSPSGGVTWTAGSTQSIRWTSTGGTGALNVQLDYSTSGSTGPWTTISTGQPGNGTFSWVVPDTPSATCHVRATVMDSATPRQSLSAVSSSFTIVTPPPPPPPPPPALTISISSPAGGENWAAGSMHNIRYYASGGTGALSVNLEYSTSGSIGPWVTISSDLSGSDSFAWTIPDSSSVNCYVRAYVVDSASPPQSSSMISNSFTITEAPPPPPPLTPTIFLFSPVGGESWLVGSFHDILWNASGGTGILRIDLEYSTTGSSGPWTVVGAGIANSGNYLWMITDAPSAYCFVRATVTDSANPSQNASVVSDSFSVVDSQPPPPVLALSISSPVGGESWLVGSTQEISWNGGGGTGILSVQLEYSTTGSAGPWIIFSTGLPANGTYAWTVPSTPSLDCYIRGTVTDSVSRPQNASNISGEAFAIYAITLPTIVLSITHPYAGITWSGGSVQTIAWESNGSNPSQSNVSLFYSTDDFVTSNVTIASAIPDSGAFDWTVPTIDCSSVRIRAILTNLYGVSSDSLTEYFEVDSTPPQVTSVQPSNGLQNVSISTVIVVTFSEKVVTSTAEAAFSIYPNTPGISWSWNLEQTAVTGTLQLSPGTTYTCTIAEGVEDSSDPGNENQESYSWSFTTSQGEGNISPLPVVVFDVEGSTVTADEYAIFNATDTFDPSNRTLVFSWDFGDGTPVVMSDNPVQVHTFSSEGKYSVKLIVSNGKAEAAQTMEVNVRSGQTMQTFAGISPDPYFVWAGSFVFLGGVFGVFYSAMQKTSGSKDVSSDPSAYSAVDSSLPTFSLETGKCVGCKFCAKNCPTGAIFVSNKKPVHDPSRCSWCMRCAEKCPREAITIVPAIRKDGD